VDLDAGRTEQAEAAINAFVERRALEKHDRAAQRGEGVVVG